MVENIKKISDILKISDYQKDFDKDIINIINILKNRTGLILIKNNIFIKDNIIKIKTISNIRFLILLNLNNINKDLLSLNKGFILEL